MTNNYVERTKKYYQTPDVAHRYYEAYAAGGNWRARFIAIGEIRSVQNLLGMTSNVRSILDIPCGTGKISKLFYDNQNYFPADISRDMMSFIPEEHKSNRIQADVAHLPIQSGYFDLVLCIRLLHRIPLQQKLQTIQEISRVSKQWIIVTCGIDSFSSKLRHLIKLMTIGTNPDMQPIKLKELIAIFKKYHLEVIRAQRVRTLVSNEYVFLLKKGLN